MAADVGDEFKPGDKVAQSGIYTVVHDRDHHQEHEVTVVHGKHFPPCRGCDGGVRFVLARKAIHIENHEQFKGQG
jgi:hypothetical protein